MRHSIDMNGLVLVRFDWEYSYSNLTYDAIYRYQYQKPSYKQEHSIHIQTYILVKPIPTG